MKNLKNVLSKIEKIELAEVNVELGLIDQIEPVKNKVLHVS